MTKDQRRCARNLLLGMIFYLILAGPAAADRAKTFEIFTECLDGKSRPAWQAGNGSPVVSGETGRNAGTRFPAVFGKNTRRVYWDRAVSLDLRGYDLLELDLTCIQPDIVRTFTLYLKSGEGWYLWSSPLKESGRQKLSFDIRGAATEGKPTGWHAINAVRISLTREENGADHGKTRAATEQTAAIIAHGLKAHSCALFIVQGTLSMANANERTYAGNRAKRISQWLQENGIRHSIIDDAEVATGRLKNARIAILPYNSLPPDRELRALESFVQQGGKLIVLYSSDPKLAKLMGLKLGSYQAAAAAGQWNSFAFNRHAPPYLPAVVYQESSNIMPAYPADNASRVIAYWQNSAGQNLADPAWLQSPNGFWMSHVLLDGDNVNKQNMLLALLGSFWPSIWEQAATRVMARVGTVGPFVDLRDAVIGITRMTQSTAVEQKVHTLLTQCQQEYALISADLAKGKYAEVVQTGQSLQTKLQEAFACTQRPMKNEFRGIWDHSGLGLYPGNWPKTASILADAGMHAIFVNVLWAGLAHYDSRIVPQSAAVSRYGDQLQQCVAAAHANHLEVHAWKICWNLGNAPQANVSAMRKAGRLQVSDTGKERAWLCPSHPDNVKLELEAIREMLKHAAVDGVHLDYARYPDANACFCDGCRRRFGQQLGEKIRDWPRCARTGSLSEKYNAWRSEQITAFVRAVQRIVRESGQPASKKVRLSVAVYPEYPACINSIGQDWGRWLKEDLVDFVCPMDYTADNAAFKNMVQRQLALDNIGRRVFPGLGVTAAESQLTPDQVIEQIRQVRAAGAGGFVLFDLNRTLEKNVLPVLSVGTTRTDR